jgi:NAD+ synthase
MKQLVDLFINPQITADKIISFIKTTVQNAGFSRVVVGLSGGLDSAVSCFLAAKALGRENVFVGLFPYGELNREGLDDARLTIDKLSIPPKNVVFVDIKPLVDPLLTDHKMDNLRKGNMMVRMRMILLYDLSKKFNALVLGTENKSEYLLGYYTRFGDEASDIEPIRHLYKAQVKQLAKHLGVPDKIINKNPTAGMWQGQTDERELGFSYEEADKILYLYTDLKESREEIIKEGFKREVVEKVIRRLKANKFKHELPYTI